MSLNSDPAIPESDGVLGTEAPDSQPAAPQRRLKSAWQGRVVPACLALVTFEIGLFLVVFPWSDHWEFNYFQQVIPWLQDLWEEPSFRGALTGLGLINIYIACLQVVRLIRRS